MKFSEFIRNNHHKFKTVGEMADFMHMSPKNFTSDEYGFKVQAHLNKYCKREFGKNPCEIRNGVNKSEQNAIKI